jgi:hypothetical protein
MKRLTNGCKVRGSLYVKIEAIQEDIELVERFYDPFTKLSW